MLLTIGIPTFNDCEILPEVLDSIKNQEKANFKNLEILIVDNASTDNTQDVVAEYIKNNPTLPIKYHRNKENIGGVANLFEIVKLAKGQYIWFICDDILYSDSIKNLENQIWKYKPDIIQVAVHGNNKKPAQIIKNFKKQDIGLSMFVGNLIMKAEFWKEGALNRKCYTNLYPHLFIALSKFRQSKVLFDYEKYYIKARPSRDYKSTPLRMLLEGVKNPLACLNANKEALGADIFGTIISENHFSRIESILVKFLWRNFIYDLRIKLSTIPFEQKKLAFFQLFKAIRFTGKQVKLLAKIGFYLFRPNIEAKTLSVKDVEYLKFRDKSNGNSNKIIQHS